MNPLNERLWSLRDAFMNKGFYCSKLFTELSEIQSLVSQAEFDVHRLTLEVERLRSENMRLEVAKAMLEPDKEFMWFIEQKLGQESLQADHKTELGVAV